jgi:hypothetical protein
VFLINLLRLKNLEEQRVSEPVEVDRDAAKASESAGVFESIRSINQEIKQTMADEMKRLGLTDEDIRHVFHETS